MSVVLSNRQNPMLQAFVGLGPQEYMSLDQAKAFDQRPFRSLLIRGWISYRRSHGFFLTKEGKQAWYTYQHTDIARKNPTQPLTAYFNPEHYLHRRPAGKVEVIRHRQAAAQEVA